MKRTSRNISVSHLKAHAAEIIRDMGRDTDPIFITQSGEAKAVLLGIETYEQTQETLALLKILARGTRQIETGKVQSATDVIGRLRGRTRG